MAIGIAEVKRLDASSRLVPFRQSLRSGGGVLHSVLAQPPVRPIHVAHDDRNVLEPPIIAAGINRDRPALWRQVVGQLDELVAQPHADDAHPQAENALELLVLTSGDFDVGHLFERQHVAVEGHGTVHVRDSHADGIHSGHEQRAGG